MTSDKIELPGEELNRRLEEISLKIERVSILIEDAMVDPNDAISLDRTAYNDLIICLAKYEEFLSHLHDTTLDTTEEIQGIVGIDESCYGVVDEDRDEEELIEEREDDMC